MAPDAPLHGIRVLECSALGPAAITMPLVDLGAEVIKVEPPAGDYIREMTWPIVEGVSLMHLHVNRGKRSIVMDLRQAEDVATFKELAKVSDVVVEAMRPGGLARRGVGYEDLRALNPRLVFCTISGYGMTGPYRDLPSHGIAFDTWAGIVSPCGRLGGVRVFAGARLDGDPRRAVVRRLGICLAVLRAKRTGAGSFLEIAQSDAAAAMDWYRSETWRAYERPESEVTGNKADGYERRDRAPPAWSRASATRSTRRRIRRFVLFMASEQAFWKNFCAAVDRMDMFERWPGSKYADHARGNLEMRRSCATSSADGRRRVDLVRDRRGRPDRPGQLAEDHRRGSSVPRPVRLDPGGASRCGRAAHPAQVRGRVAARASHAPTVGEHTDSVLAEVLGWDAARIAESRSRGGLGGAGGRVAAEPPGTVPTADPLRSAALRSDGGDGSWSGPSGSSTSRSAGSVR